MALLSSPSKSRPLVEHPEFPLMLARTLDRFHCTLAEVREDYWLGRAWRALGSDAALEGRIARLGVSHILITGPDFSPAPSGRERARWHHRVRERLAAHTAHTTEALGMEIRFAEAPVEVAQGCMLSLLAQVIGGDERFLPLTEYADDLAPVVLPVAYSSEAVVAA
ncbi:MAG TPA: hypothetical protein VGI92_08310 [Gemmatimonadales bacterium]|jgi:hypothetical protein